jgi:hypothetical protein
MDDTFEQDYYDLIESINAFLDSSDARYRTFFLKGDDSWKFDSEVML